MKNEKKIKTVLVDIDNTLIDFKKSSAKAMRLQFEDYGLPFSQRTPEVYHEISEPLWRAVERGEISQESLWLRRWNDIFAVLGIKEDGVSFEKQWEKNLSETYFLIDGASELLRHLHQKYLVCVASNSRFDQQYARLSGSGLLEYVDKIFVSEKIGYSKPDARFFNECLSVLGNSADEVIMIGDSLIADITGAKRAGIKTCWFNPSGDVDSIGADFEVSNLTDITEIL